MYRDSLLFTINNLLSQQLWKKKKLTRLFETKITFKDYIDGFITAKLGANSG